MEQLSSFPRVAPQCFRARLSRDGKLTAAPVLEEEAQYDDAAIDGITITSRVTDEEIDLLVQKLDSDMLPPRIRKNIRDELVGVAIEAAKAELRLFESTSRELYERLHHLTVQVLKSEDDLLRAADKAGRIKKQQIDQAAEHSPANAAKVNELAASLIAEGCTTPTLLAKRLGELRSQLAKSQLSLQKFQGRGVPSSPTADQGLGTHANLDDHALHQQWAIWRQEKTTMLRDANTEHIQLARENARLRSVLKATATAENGTDIMRSIQHKIEKKTDELTEMRLLTKAAQSELEQLRADVRRLRAGSAHKSPCEISDFGATTSSGKQRASNSPKAGLASKNPSEEDAEKEALIAVIADAKRTWKAEKDAIAAQISAISARSGRHV